MTELRERMIRAMQLRNYSPQTQKSYISCIVRLTRHYRRPPDSLSQKEIEDYLLHLMVKQGHQASSVRTYMSALRFFYLETLGRDPREFVLPTLRESGRLPDILSAGELVRLFRSVENRKHRRF